MAQPASEAAISTAIISAARPSLVAKFASKYAIEPAKLLSVLKATAFKQGKDDPEVSNEQMAALLVVADQYGLNPFTREIYAFADKNKGVIPIVGIDGWSRIINDKPELDGIEFNYSAPGEPQWTECIIHRKDRSKPVIVREYLSECRRSTGPWGSHPNRMLRHKAMIQCARIAFGFAGIYDPDEGERIIERDVTPEWTSDKPLTGAAGLKAAVTAKPAPVDIDTGEIQGASMAEDDDPTLGIPGAGDISHVGAPEPDQGKPEIDPVKLLARLESFGDVDTGDADASLIGEVPDFEWRNRLTVAYQKRRAEITGKQTKGRK